jgi:beta-lactamase class A
VTSLDDALGTLARERSAVVSVWMGEVGGRPWHRRDADRVHPAASTMKLPLVIALHRAADEGVLDLDEEVPVRAVLPSQADGQAYETTYDYDNDDQPWERIGGTATLAWLAERAIVRSSNLATNLLVDRLGLDPVNAVYAAAGATRSRVERGIQDEPAMTAGLANTVTAADLAAVVAALARREIASPDGCEAVERLLARCEHNDAAAAGLPDGTYFAHKTGWFDGVAHDVGLVRPDGEPPFVLAVLTGSDLDEPGARGLVADVAAACWANRHRVARTDAPEPSR